ncbi:hypothetical protein AB0K48_45650, partial [Nonomuraea sp. NPDC055795]
MVAEPGLGEVPLAEQSAGGDHAHARRVSGLGQEGLQRRQRRAVRALPGERLGQTGRDGGVARREQEGGAILALGLGEVALAQEQVRLMPRPEDRQQGRRLT